MIRMRVNSSAVTKAINNAIQYASGFMEEMKAKSPYLSRKLANTSINEFYMFLDSLARTNPGLYHHVYEWSQVGNPSARLYELKAELSSSKTMVVAEFLQSETLPPERPSSGKSKRPFYNKAEVMESGTTVFIQEVEADVLYFDIDGVEYFRTGPIVIENPGGIEVRGQFVAAFEEFYNTYFTQVYLRSIRFYNHISEARPFVSSFVPAVHSGNARSIGRSAAMTLIIGAPGDDYE